MPGEFSLFFTMNRFRFLQKMYLFMELCEGGELADALKEKGMYSEEDTKTIMRKLACAIKYLHKHGKSRSVGHAGRLNQKSGIYRGLEILSHIRCP